MASYVNIGKTVEQFEQGSNRNRIPNYENILKAWKRVCANKSEYYSETVGTYVKTTEKTVIKAYIYKELYIMYGVTAKTFKKWLKTANIDIPSYCRTLTPIKVREIFEKLELPA
ncbi:hypothetical protein I5M32_02560 [Pedobacter sp. SD-b]|uniref:Uncharacterized protein n=2 Tax=Pedobacter segetis TaxID=2793069 RepID=A0ABS1BGA5_9SPHI|nr:hypothetical protein [Pedobacter segetis]